MKRPPPIGQRSRADLVWLIAALAEPEWEAAAAAAGFIPDPAVPVAKPKPPSGRGRAMRKPPDPPLAPPYQPADLPDLPFWRVTAQTLLPLDPAALGAPAWLTQARPLDELPVSDPNVLPPLPPPLVPAARQARFLRASLAEPRGRSGVDLDVLEKRLAERRPPARLPYRKCPRWPARVHLLLDFDAALRPFWDDFWDWEAQLRRALGDRLTVWAAPSGDPARVRRVADDTPGAIPLRDGAVVVIGDAGLYAPASARAARWLAWGQRCREGGQPVLLLAPVPPRLADTSAYGWCRIVLWDAGAALAQYRGHRAPEDDRLDDAASGLPSGARALFAALADASRVEPPLLRALRLALRGLGADIGSEYEIWHHADIRSNLLACALAPDARAKAKAEFERWPADLRGRITDLRQRGNRHQSPLIRAEEALAGEADGAESVALLRSLAATLDRGGDAAARAELTAYLQRITHRRPDLFAASPELGTAWALSRRAELRAGTVDAFPPGIDRAALAWLTDQALAGPPLFLGQAGSALGLFPIDSARPVCRLAELTPGAGLLEVAPDGDGKDAGAVQVYGAGTAWLPDAGRRYRVHVGPHRLDLDAVRRPPWALGIGRCADGLFSELADGRRVFWMPRRAMAVDSSTAGLSFVPPHGFWWDEAEYRAFLGFGQRWPLPEWAVRHGVDEFGYWAEFQVNRAVQRLRWIPPGEFSMGSPPDEPERSNSQDFDETQHPVVLTRGYWLADTACTQSLWQAVLDENPSRFTGADRPVENVSWEDIVERFLPALNQRVPGLAAVLPGEAQWEYACRAGTATPFWFGENITPEQVNYDGDYPYADGKDGLNRAETVPVTALPANGWGHYQMHGNVWEWCEDWLGAYPQGLAVDPTGPLEGQERVLRGGCWFGRAWGCRSADRNGSVPGLRSGGIGFRLARGFPEPAVSGAGAGVAAGGGAPAAAPDRGPRGQRSAKKKKAARKS